MVIWHGIEDTDESNEFSGYGWDADDETYPGLGPLDESTYEHRIGRLRSGLAPLEAD